MPVNELSILPIYDGTVFMDPLVLVLDKTPVDWSRHADLMTEDGKLELTIGGFLIVGSGDRVVLVDTGFGADQEHFGALKDSLRAAGYDPSQITDVVLTHLHADHVGAVTERGEVSFPNATYRCHSADWTFFASATAQNADNADTFPGLEKLTTLMGSLDPWDADGTILPGIDVIHAPGHTPGSSVVVVSSGRKRWMLLGDAVHCPAQLLEPEWSTVHDVDPKLAARTREAIVKEMDTDGAVAAGAHFPGLRFGRVLEGAGPSRFGFAD